MARAEIYLEDDEDGKLSLAVRYIGGADVKSGAHQVANILRMHAETILEQAAPITVLDTEGNVVPDSAPVEISTPSAA